MAVSQDTEQCRRVTPCCGTVAHGARLLRCESSEDGDGSGSGIVG